MIQLELEKTFWFKRNRTIQIICQKIWYGMWLCIKNDKTLPAELWSDRRKNEYKDVAKKNIETQSKQIVNNMKENEEKTRLGL